MANNKTPPSGSARPLGWRDVLLAPARAIASLLRKLASQKPSSIADFDVSVDDMTDARVHAWTIFLALLVAGTSLLVWNAHLSATEKGHAGTAESTASLLSGHFGIALVVAAFAGVGFEVFAHHYKLQQQIFTLFRVNHHVAALQVDAVLQRLIPNRSGDDRVHERLRRNLAAMIHYIDAIATEKGAEPLVSLRFILRLLRYATAAAHTLQVGIELEQPHDLMLPPTAAALADEILADHMRTLKQGDYYNVISDFSTWRGWQLPHFWKAITDTDPTVKITRVFCRFKQDEMLSACEAMAIMERHWTLAQTLQGRYEVAVSNRTDVDHVGIFRHDGVITSFRPHGKGRLTTITVDHGLEAEDAGLAQFEEVFNTAKVYCHSSQSWADVVKKLHDEKFFDNFGGCHNCALLHSASCDRAALRSRCLNEERDGSVDVH